jgi:hypothetical protein
MAGTGYAPEPVAPRPSGGPWALGLPIFAVVVVGPLGDEWVCVKSSYKEDFGKLGSYDAKRRNPVFPNGKRSWAAWPTDCARPGGVPPGDRGTEGRGGAPPFSPLGAR